MGKKKSAEEGIIEQISGILARLDVESLVFLKEQADILLYNKSVREKNAQIKETATKKTTKAKTYEKSEPSKAPVYFEPVKEGKFFNLCIGDARIFMDKSEVRSILKIAMAAGTASEGSQRLYAWFSRERKDVLVDGHIGSSTHQALPMIYRELLETFEAN